MHQAAGSKRVLELHGTVHKNHCLKCGKFYDMDYIAQSNGVPHCDCGGVIKPDVVLYGESLDEYTVSRSVRAIENADTLIVAGTSLTVYPAAGLIRYFGGDNLISYKQGRNRIRRTSRFNNKPQCRTGFGANYNLICTK